MVEIKIKIEGLDQLTEAMALLGSALAYRGGLVNTAEAAVELMEDVKSKVKKEDKDKEETIVEEVKETSTEDAPALQNKYTREEVRAAFVAKNSPSNRNQLKAILDKYGASNISELKEEYFEAIMKDLEEL